MHPRISTQKVEDWPSTQISTFMCINEESQFFLLTNGKSGLADWFDNKKWLLQLGHITDLF